MNQRLIDPETRDVIQCERCNARPATRELDYQDERFTKDAAACDYVCYSCWSDERPGLDGYHEAVEAAVVEETEKQTFTPSEVAEISALLNPVAADGDTTKGA